MGVLEKQIAELEKKVSALVRTNARIQLQTSDALARLDKAVDRLRKALPHVNFED